MKIIGDIETRKRLMEERKPTIVKSMRSGRWYCAIGITQSERLVFSFWHTPDRKATARVTYGIGNTPAQAYAAFTRRAGFMDRFARLHELNRQREAVKKAHNGEPK